MKTQKGITIIALVITIVIMLILAGVSVTVALNGGLFSATEDSKYQTEIANEIETVQLAQIMAEGESVNGIVTVEDIQSSMNSILDEGEVTAIDNGETIVVHFNESNRYYEIENNGNVTGPIDIIFDSKAGVLDGTGSSIDPFIIMSIEDLVFFSQSVNNGNDYSGKYIELGKTLDFNSDLSYENPNTTEYDEYLGGDGTVGLKEQLTIGLGFKPIGMKIDTTTYYFRGNFDGKNNSIKNIKIDTYDVAGLFGNIRGNVSFSNLTISGDISCEGNTAWAGGLIGQGYAASSIKLSNIINYCKVVSTSTGTYGASGGIIGFITIGGLVHIESCVNYGEISVYGGHVGAGGLIGRINNNSISILNTVNKGIIQVPNGDTAYRGAGGFIGTTYPGRSSWLY